MFKTIFTPENESQLVITLPKECLHKKVEIRSVEMDDSRDTILERNERRKKNQTNIARCRWVFTNAFKVLRNKLKIVNPFLNK
jgi:hypothetical protein